MIKSEHIEEIERYLKFNYEAGLKGAANQAQKEVNQKYKEDVENIPYYYYINSADLHYFIGRQLFYKHIGTYAYFCAHQCVENYLKALLKYLDQTPPNKHQLVELVENIKSKTNQTEYPFIHSDEIQMIASHFEPFYELSRYPVQNVRPKGNNYMMVYPTGIEILDLFVYRMRELISIPDGARDIMKEPHHSLHSCESNFPDFYNLFKVNNINFE